MWLSGHHSQGGHHAKGEGSEFEKHFSMLWLRYMKLRVPQQKKKKWRKFKATRKRRIKLTQYSEEDEGKTVIKRTSSSQGG